MDSQYFSGNRARLYAALPAGSLLAVFSGEEIRKTSDEFYPFFAERNFVYLTGLECKQAVLLAMKDGAETVRERLYILPPDAHAERWTGKRIRPSEAEATSGVRDVRRADAFSADLHALATSGHYERLYLDLYRMDPKDIERPAHRCLALARREYPYLQIGNASILIRRLRAIKQPCEIAALAASGSDHARRHPRHDARLQARHVRIPIQSGIRPRAGPVWPQRPRLPFHHLGRQKQFLHPLL